MGRPKRTPLNITSEQAHAILAEVRAAATDPTPYRRGVLEAIEGGNLSIQHSLIMRLGPNGLECKRVRESDRAWRLWDGHEI